MKKSAILTYVPMLMCLAGIVVLFALCASISFSAELHRDWRNSLKPRGKAGPMLTLAESGRA